MSIEYLDEGFSRIAINHNGDAEPRKNTGLEFEGTEFLSRETPFTRFRDGLIAKLGENPLFIQKKPVLIGPEEEVMDELYVRLGGLKDHTAHLTMRPRTDGGYELELEQIRDLGKLESVTRYSVDDKAWKVTGSTARRPSAHVTGNKVIGGDETAMEDYVLEASDVDERLAIVTALQPLPSFRKRCITTIL